MSNELKIVKGNTFWTLTEVRALDASGYEIQDFDLAECTDIKVYLRTSYKRTEVSAFQVLEGNILQVMWYGPLLSISKYSMEVAGKYNDVDWRFFDANVLTIVETNAEANIPQGAFVAEGFFQIQPSELVILTSIPQVQADWNENDIHSAAYIKNKPFIPSIVDEVDVSDGNLLITFNTTSGKETISLSLLDIFNPSNYYTKQDVNNIMETTYGRIGTILRNSVFRETVYKGVWEEGEYEKDSMVDYQSVLYVALRNTVNCPLNNDGTVNEDWTNEV